ncbi:MAG: TonB-dependent receptor, partial [Bacteroidota bacterium]
LKPAVISGKDITVTGKGRSGTEEALLNQRRKSSNVVDGISAAQLKKLPDATGADALARVTGLSIVGGRFVNVRGSSERYSNTQVNGVPQISTEPDKRSFSFDLIPSNLLENTVVTKTFTPDLPGDFSGGLVQLNTIDFPDRTTFRVSVTGGYRGGTTFDGISMGPRGSTDYIGVDDGHRQLPSDFPDTPRITKTNFKPAELAAFARELPNNWVIRPVSAAPNMSYLLSYGDSYQVLDNDLGLISAFSYRSGFNRTAIRRVDRFRTFDYSGEENQYSTLWGGMLNLSYKLSDLHTISIKNTYTRTAEDELTMVQGILKDGPYDNKLYTFRYLEREIYSGQIAGEHTLPALGDMKIKWHGYGSLGDRNEPDTRRIIYTRNADDTTQPYQTPLSATLLNAYGSGRLYSNMSEELFGFGADVTVPVGAAKIRVGGLAENKARTFKARSFAYSLSDSSRYLAFAALDTLFQESNLRSNALTIQEVTQLSDKYDGGSHLRAAYAMVDLPFSISDLSFRAIAGARLEDCRTELHTADIKPINVDYPTTDWLPSLNLMYEVTPTTNIRLAYSRTVARPEFREYARFGYYNFILDALVYGNPELRRTLIRNYDFRFETFPDAGELIAVSVFHKQFTDAIEEAALPGNSPERTWANADGTNTGVELELRKSFGFIAEALSPLSFSINYTWLDSKIIVDTTRFSARVERRLQGQSPYIVNAGIYYDNTAIGSSVALVLNRFGERIVTVGRNEQPNYVEQPRTRLDMTYTQTFGNFEMKLSVKDLTAGDKLITQYGDEPAQVDTGETSVSLGLGLKF